MNTCGTCYFYEPGEAQWAKGSCYADPPMDFSWTGETEVDGETRRTECYGETDAPIVDAVRRCCRHWRPKDANE